MKLDPQLVIIAIIAVLCFVVPLTAAYLHQRKMARLDREWREKNPEQAAMYDYYSGDQWTEIEKAQIKAQQSAPLQFNKTKIVMPSDPDEPTLAWPTVWLGEAEARAIFPGKPTD